MNVDVAGSASYQLSLSIRSPIPQAFPNRYLQIYQGASYIVTPIFAIGASNGSSTQWPQSVPSAPVPAPAPPAQATASGRPAITLPTQISPQELEASPRSSSGDVAGRHRGLSGRAICGCDCRFLRSFPGIDDQHVNRTQHRAGRFVDWRRLVLGLRLQRQLRSAPSIQTYRVGVGSIHPPVPDHLSNLGWTLHQRLAHRDAPRREPSRSQQRHDRMPVVGQ